MGCLSLGFVMFQIHGKDGAKYPRYIKWSPQVSQDKLYDFVFKRHFGLINKGSWKSLCFETLPEAEKRNIQLAFINYFPLSRANCELNQKKILFKSVQDISQLKNSCSTADTLTYLSFKVSIQRNQIMSTDVLSKFYPLSLEKRAKKYSEVSRFYSMLQVTQNCFLIPKVLLHK